MLGSVNLIETFLNANLTSAVTEVESENGVSITPLAELLKYTSKGRQFPVLSILPSGTEPTPTSAGNRSFFGNPSSRSDLIMLQVWARGNIDVSRQVETDVIGYMDSLEKLFSGDYAITGVKGVEILDTSYTELFPDPLAEGQLLLKGATLLIKVRYNII